MVHDPVAGTAAAQQFTRERSYIYTISVLSKLELVQPPLPLLRQDSVVEEEILVYIEGR